MNDKKLNQIRWEIQKEIDSFPEQFNRDSFESLLNDYAKRYSELHSHNVNPRYFLVVQEYGDDEFFLNVVSSKFPTYKSANNWLNNEATKIRFPHAYIIGVY